MNFWHGLSTVVSLELKQRVRSKLWVWALVIWFLFIGAVTSLVMTVVTTSSSPDRQQESGPLAFGLIVLFVLGMGLVIAPTFTATSINSDRSQSVLATLQATRLSALQIALGKLAAAWGISLLFIAAALPFIVWTVALGNISLAQVAACFAAIFIEVAVVCAIGLGWSALVARPVGSAVLTYLSVLTLCVLTLVVELLSLSLVVEDDEVRVWGLSSTDQTAYEEQYYSGDSDDWVNAASWAEKCTWNREQTTAPRFDKVWWLSLPNP
ncbi:MAG: ABC transporter permease, partial [Propionibacteriaceae bacterium]|nr:ABC transporter permease [Propionibacteriaceae bacterium]